MTAGLLTLWLLLGVGFAQDEAPATGGIEIRRLADIYALLPPPGAKKWEPSKVVAAVEASTMRFSPKHVYELIDKEVPQPIIQAVANKCGLFYDGTHKPLQVQAAEARAGAAAETLSLDGTSFPTMYSWFDGIFKEIHAAEEALGIPKMKGANETDALYERRQRTWEEERVKQLGPMEGRIQAATFQIDVPATTKNAGGCDRPVAVGDATTVDFDLFRQVAGGRLSETPVQLASHSVEKAFFAVAPVRGLVVYGRCGAKGSSATLTLKRSAEGAWSGSGDFR
jgi:hypothetical protein